MIETESRAMNRLIGARDATPETKARVASISQALVKGKGIDAVRVAGAALAPLIYATFARGDKVKECGGRVCWKRLVGKRCAASYGYRPCNCLPPGTDHPSIWKKEDGNLVFVSQPYSLSSKTLKEMVEFAEANGLEFTVSALGSWHFPLWTTIVVWQKKGDPGS